MYESVNEMTEFTRAFSRTYNITARAATLITSRTPSDAWESDYARDSSTSVSDHASPYYGCPFAISPVHLRGRWRRCLLS